MEIWIAVFLGGWLSLASVLAYLQLRKDFRPYLKEDDKKPQQEKKDQ